MPSSPIALTFLQQGVPGQAALVANLLTEFIRGARQSLHLAVYDFRLRDPALAGPVVAALRERAAAGVDVRIAYDKGKPLEAPADFAARTGTDPAPIGTAEFVSAIGGGVQSRAIKAAPQLMHNKYVLRDGHTPNAAVWTGSANFTDDSWTLQESNILRIASPALAALYETDFSELWANSSLFISGINDAGTVTLPGGARVEVAFSPEDGKAINQHIARLIGGARSRVWVGSMILSSGASLGALVDVLDRGQVEFGGITDATQMEGVLDQWRQLGGMAGKIALFEHLKPALAGKRSTPYAPATPHDFMHNKIVVVDDAVVTGSYNFSNNATRNAENCLTIYDAEVADQYVAYLAALARRYGTAA